MASAAPNPADNSLERLSPVVLQVAEHAELAAKVAGSLLRADFAELKALKAPPKGVLELLRVVLQLLNQEPCNLDWADVKNFCADPKFAQRLIAFPPATATDVDHDAIAALPALDPKANVAFATKVQKWLSETNLAALRVRGRGRSCVGAATQLATRARLAAVGNRR